MTSSFSNFMMSFSMADVRLNSLDRCVHCINGTETVALSMKETDNLLTLAKDRILFHLVIPEINIFTSGIISP